MYRTVEDFINDWSESAASTLNVIRAISDDKLDVAIVEGHNSLGWLAWHVTTAPVMFGNMLAGLGLEVKLIRMHRKRQWRKLLRHMRK